MNKEIILYEGCLQHPHKYFLAKITVSEDYIKQSGLTIEQLRKREIDRYYEQYNK